MHATTTTRATALTMLLTLGAACGQQPAPADPILVINPEDMTVDHSHHGDMHEDMHIHDAAPDLEPADMPDMSAEDMAPDLMTYPSTLPPVLGLTTLPDLHPDPHIVEVRLTVQEAEQQILQGAKTKLLTYNGLMPGPLIHAKVGDRLIIHVQNELDEDTLIHWHGLRISDQMDGSPILQRPIKSKQSFTYDFVVPDAGTFWYHTHLHQIEQLERGLYGGLVVHEATPPAFHQEHILVLDDVRLDLQNQISPFLTSGPDIGRGRVGNNLLVNGQASVQTWELPRGAVQRWRVVSAHNALSYGLRIQGAKNARVIATDGGILPAPFPLERVEIAPGQRYEIEVEAADDAAQVTLEAMILSSDGNGGAVDRPFPLARATVTAPLDPPLPRPVYPAITHPDPAVEAPEHTWHLSGGVVGGEVQFTINGQAAFAPDDHDGHGGHQHAILQTFQRGQPVRIKLTSDVSPVHPFHIHGQFFQILERNGQPADEPGLRDTVEVRGRGSVTILSYFENPGQWMVHCHISEHGENGMMADIVVQD